MSEQSTDDVCNCKVGRQQEASGLSNLNARLVERRRSNEASLRDLAAFVNICVLEARIERTSADVAGDPRSIYEALTGSDVSPERRADVTDQLELVGIDVDDLRSDFVSHQTVKTHLRDCLGVDTSREKIASVDEGRAKIKWVQDHQRTVTANVVDQLVREGFVSIGDYELTQTTSITCTECNQSYRLDEFLDDQQCECGD